MEELLGAAVLGSVDATRKALARGASVECKNGAGQTALLLATEAGNFAVMKLLLEHKANPNAADMNGWTPLHCACYLAQQDATCLLTQHGADPNQPAQYVIRHHALLEFVQNFQSYYVLIRSCRCVDQVSSWATVHCL